MNGALLMAARVESILSSLTLHQALAAIRPVEAITVESIAEYVCCIRGTTPTPTQPFPFIDKFVF